MLIVRPNQALHLTAAACRLFVTCNTRAAAAGELCRSAACFGLLDATCFGLIDRRIRGLRSGLDAL
jgi:hypothetical protein